MSGKDQSLLDLVVASGLLHQGGEADIYNVSARNRLFVLKWYKAKKNFDTDAIKKIASLDGAGVYKVREFGERSGHSYVVYDYLSGTPLSGLNLPVVVALYVMRKLVRALKALKVQGLFHGDLNPGNVVLTFTDGVLQPVLIDFGIVGPGALAYAAPERFQGKSADEKSDMYSLGMLLFYMVFGSELVVANGYDGYASASLDVDQRDISGELYASGRFTVQEISALAPLWKTMIRSGAADRAEDLDELDELLEIALNGLAAGEMTVQKAACEFAEAQIKEKTRQKVPVAPENALPYKIGPRQKKNSYLKVSVLGGFVLILIVLGIVLMNPGKRGVDDAGASVLQKSRSLESTNLFSDSLQADSINGAVDTNLLRDLPTPQSQE